MPASINTADTANLFRHVSANEQIRAPAKTTVAVSSISWHAPLDYRRWHRFRVERWQDGQWRKLSGPASSGERALGLTVPLFAAVASFYSHGNFALAPRLMLLDEAFAGIDDTARAYCMGLIREFDLDFVITSEREWGCYATLPGVAICQLQRREGIDAVIVSRWTWDGRTKARDADPGRRFPAP
ncbi:SbcC/MukB-like Walker B domain-containing protein [Caballeronia sp. 15715]|uniref:SbcC/MukB-like Walker B domain-containing protein n=1 Tax=Caballeronia sp. 15715 TaxID=3391030 RepID=UPI0039E3DC62